MFGRLDFDIVFLSLTAMNLTYMGTLYVLPFFLQKYMELSIMESGIILLLPAVAPIIFSIPVGKYSETRAKEPFSVAACGLLALGFFLLFLAADEKNMAVISVALILMGLSWAIGGPMSSCMIEHTYDDFKGMASSLTNEAYYLGGALGISACALIFNMAAGITGINIGDVPADMFLPGFTGVCIVMTIIMALATLACATVKKQL